MALVLRASHIPSGGFDSVLSAPFKRGGNQSLSQPVSGCDLHLTHSLQKVLADASPGLDWDEDQNRPAEKSLISDPDD